VLTRTGSGGSPRGRITPFNSTPSPPGDGLPEADPWISLATIDATLGTQTRPWICTPPPDQQPLPMPQPTVRGLNTFLSVFEITIDVNLGWTPFEITVGGSGLAAMQWRTVGTPIPPDCGNPNIPGDDVPGSITYEPVLAPSVALQGLLRIIPAPGSAALVAIAALGTLRRRRP
jgi:hypothetical protein